MKEQLRQIYADLSNGRLSQREALDQIKAIKLQEQGSTASVLAPVWLDAEAAPSARDAVYAERHVVLCDIAASVERVGALLPLSECTLLQTDPEATIDARFDEVALACFEQIQTIFRDKPQGKVLLQAVVGGEPEQVLLAGLAGMLKTASLENPQFAGQLIVVPAETTVEELVTRLEAERSRARDTLVRYQEGVRQVLRWEVVHAETVPAAPAFDDRGVYLITGGLGGLAVLFAREILARTPEAKVILAGRSALGAEKQTVLDQWRFGGRVSYRQADVCDFGQVRQLVAGILQEHGKLDGILHCAGVIADEFILKKETPQFSAVLAPKVDGTVNLDKATRDVALDFFVLFSSVAGVLGNVAQADYAAANGFMDRFAVYRNRLVAAGERHGRTRSINWPLWQDGGMGSDAESRELLQLATGIPVMQTATGMQAFHRSLALPYDQVLVVEGDPSPILRALAGGQASAEAPRAAQPVLDTKTLAAKTEDYVRQELSGILKLPAQNIDPQAALEKYGIDSILAMKLTGQLEKSFGPLSKTLFFEYLTLRDLAQYFVETHTARLEELFSSTESADAQPVRTALPATQAKRAVARPASRPRAAAASLPVPEADPIAIVGLSGRYPEAVDLDAYWNNLRDGKDCIIEVPAHRWDWKTYFSDDRTQGGHHYSKWGGFIAGVDEFDPLFFNISPKEAKLIDPQERLFLQHAWMAIEDAGYTRAALQVAQTSDLAGQVGVYVGVMYTEYQLFGADASARGQRLGIAGSAASIANRVSYAFNLHGPSVTLDTMCSSSLTAIHFACQDLKSGRTTLAIAGGVNVSIHPNKYLVLSAGQFISGDGHCQSFGEGGDGYIPGEGVGVVVLKRLSEAERDGDHIYGVIRGSALNHGGKTNGYSVPNPQAQASAISRALAESKTDARHVSYIEAHGTGTKLGDPIEIAALSRAFRPYTEENGFCLIGSAKSNIGHCESAAGIAGLTKVLLQMQHRQIVPSLHSAQLNPHIDFAKTPFIVNQTLRPWEPPVVDGRTLPRIAGISSFGAGGSNAHVLIEEYRPAAKKPLALPVVAIVLSARTPEQLRQKAADLLAFVRPRLDTIDLASVAHTLQAGREAMDERLGLVVASAQQLADRLEAYCAGQAVEELFQGQVPPNRETPDAELQHRIDRSLAENRLAELLDVWVKGVEIDWRRLYGEDTPRRVSLPTYPFARDRYWIEIQAAAPVGTVLHPLLHRNVSDLSEQRYSSTFTGSEPFAVERAGRKVLPAAAYLEMARAAVEQALPERVQSGIVELRDVVWAEPVELRGSRQVNVALFPAGDDIEFEIYSREGDEEIVHCSGRAAVIETADIPSIQQGNGQLLARLRLPEGVEKDAAYVLHPALVESALHAAAASRGLSSGQALAALDSLRVISACTNEMDAWVRDSGTLDIDLCDEQGRVCAQLRGVSWQAVAAKREAPVVAARAAREITLTPQPAGSAVAARKKRAPISLDAPRPELGRIPVAARPAITLSATMAGSPAAPASSAVHLYDRGEGIFSIEVAAGASIADLRNALQRAREEASIKVLVISGAGHCFARGGRDDVNDAVEQKLCEVVAAFPAPVIAAVPGDAVGAGFLLASLCDFMVCSDEARYGWDLAPTAAEEVLFAERFGEARAHDLLVLSKISTGAQLRAKGWTGPIVPAAQVEAFAQQLATSLAAKTQDALRLLKQHLTRRLAEAAGALTRVEPAAEPPVNADALAGTIASLPQHLGLELAADGVLIVTAAADAKDLESLLNAVGGQARAVVLAGDAFSGGVDPTAVADLERVIADSTIPVVAALQHNAKGNAWLVAQFCDAAVYAEQGVYSAAQVDDGAAFAAFARRFGAAAAREILLTGADYSGADLRRRAGTVLAVDQARVLPIAAAVASAARKQRAAGVVREIPRALPDSGGREDALVPGPIALRSSVVTATAHPGGIVVVAMEDRHAKNMLSQALTEGMREAFDHIAQTPSYKVVVLTGYDQYFSSGGTKDNLLAIQAGKARFTDSMAFQLPLDCELPVIAAVQGHGIGAGWSLGMFADLALLSEESSYTSPYMGYGFTPGAGATLSLADKIGADLARESLLTAEPQTGRALKERGLLLPVLPRAQVAAAAMALAERIALAPRERLVALKRHGAAHLREQLDETYRLELAMHEQTFVGRSDTLARIERTFHQEAEAPVVPAPQAKSVADADLLPAVTATLRALLANELQMRESDINDHTQFIDVGLDSISGVSWIRKVNEKYQTSIEATKVYSYPTLAQLSLYVKGEAEARGTLGVPAPPVALAAAPRIALAAPAAPAAETRTPRKRRKSARFAAVEGVRRAPQSIAVIGMAGQFPQARNLDEFWRNISEGRNCISRVTRERWDVDAFYQPGDVVAGKSYSEWLGALDEYDRFDPRFFNISPTEAEFMDPQQRLFLQACWHGIEHAGYDARTLSGSKCGVFVGCASGDYHQLSRQHRLSAHGFTGAAMSILASRISYFLNLQGPCVSVDTACSSSLVALAQACDSLSAGDCDLAMAGGVYVMAGPEMHIRTSQAAMLSPEGRCFTFDQRADGFVPGEGVGVVVLKRLADAERDGDLVYGVIEGWGVNQDGKTNGITAPSPESQTRLMQDVYDKYRIEPANIQLVEAHGTGTKLGDPIEVEALKASFKKYVQTSETCAVGSVKSNIGHCLTAAGIAGVIKLLLALQHKQLPPTINFERLNEHIDLTGSPFYINTQLRPWEVERTARRQAAISCFGFSGTNAHVVIGEAPARVADARVSGAKLIVPLSARTPEQLRQKAEDLLVFLRGDGSGVALHELAYTLQVGRAAMDERLGFVAGSVDELAQKLEAWVRGESGIADTWQGQVKRSKDALSLFSVDVDLQETVAKWIANQRLARLAELWVKGLELDWTKLYGDARPRRISLPLYPFAKERYWIDAVAEKTATVTKTVLHPLLHSNVSSMSEQRFRSVFEGDEFFVAGQSGQLVLPAAVQLEMARAAVDQAWPGRPEGALELREIVWGQPIVVGTGSPVSISLTAVDDEQIDFEICSGDAGAEVVHCQGRVSLTREAAPAALDLRQRIGETLTRLQLPDALAGSLSDFVLHPAILGGAFDAGADSAHPIAASLQSLRVLAPFSAEMVAVCRRAAGDDVDIDLADAQGNVCAQLRGLALRRETAGTLLAVPSWVARDAQAGPFEYAEHHVIVCELPGVDSAELQSLLPQSRCLSLHGNGEDIARRYSAYALGCFERLQAILQSKPQGEILVQVAVAGDGEHALFAGLSALLKTAAMESPRLAGQLLLLPPDTSTGQLAERLQNEKRRGNDPLVRYEAGARQVLRWQEAASAPGAAPAFRDHGVYLITGGMGSLGRVFAREILARAPHAEVILTGRGPLDAGTQALLDGLSAHGRASYRQVDLGDLAQVERLIAAIVGEHQRLDGILHCAGMTADNLIVKKSAPEVAAVLAPKVTGAYHLDQASRGVPLDIFVLFSSVAGALGNAGQADYAAANAFLDHFAAHRNRQVAAGERHGRTRSINWPLWQEGGLAIDAATRELLRQAIGVEPMLTATGLESFHRALALRHDQTLVMAGDTARITAWLRQARLFESAATEEVRGTAEAISLTQLQQQLKTILAAVLRIDAESIDADQAFIDLGLDSFLGAELIVAVNKAFGTALSHMRLFDYSSVTQFALFLQKELAAVSVPPEKSAPARTRSMPAGGYPTLTRKPRPGRRTGDRAPSDDRIAIIGMSGRYPQAGDLRLYWENLTAGRSSVTEVPPSRWDVERYYDPVQGRKDKTYSKWLGAIDDHDCFDPLFFRISPQEAEFMDPQHRLFLQESYRAFEDAGYSVSGLSNQKCGVYLGISTNEYMSLLSRHGVMSAPVTSNSSAIAAARIAYYLNLKGPAISVDTACSSSLVALHLASQAILNGEIDMALAGGVSLWLTADSYVAMSQANMFSPSGQCKTFDDSADGIVNGEGVGAVVLKRLRDAERDGDTIHGVILGSGINQDGRTNGITAPSVNSQIELERGLYARHGIDPETINYVETHGTGTKLGDPIELEALSTVFSEKTTRKNFCALGSVKSNIGHTTSAAGVAGLQKVLLSMRHRTLVPTLNVTKENSRFDFQGSPFYVSRETKPWEAAPGSLRRAAVSSFGFSGTNAHLVVEEYPSPAPVVQHDQQSFIVPLSARTADQLRQKAHDLLAFLHAERPVDLAAIAYTLQVGREAMEERLGFLVTSVDQLAEKLAAFAAGEKNIAGMHRGRVEPGSDGLPIIGHDDDMQEAVEKWIARRKLPNLLDLWIRGLSFDWSKLYGADKPRRTSLPAYPFARERYWFQATPAAQPRHAEECPLASDADIRSIEEIINQIADEAVETGPAVQALKTLARPPYPPSLLATSADVRTKASK